MRRRHAAKRPQQHAEEVIREDTQAGSSLLGVKDLRNARYKRNREQIAAAASAAAASGKVWRAVDPGVLSHFVAILMPPAGRSSRCWSVAPSVRLHKSLPNSSSEAASAAGGLLLSSRAADDRSKKSRRRAACPRRHSSSYIEIRTAPVPVRVANSTAIGQR